MPAACGGDRAGQAPLAVERSEHLVDVHESGLELDHEQVPGRGVPCQLVDDAALPVEREGDLRLDYPAWLRGEECREALREVRVPAAQQPIGVTTAPSTEQATRMSVAPATRLSVASERVSQ